jgi:hypothetical protein
VHIHNDLDERIESPEGTPSCTDGVESVERLSQSIHVSEDREVIVIIIRDRNQSSKVRIGSMEQALSTSFKVLACFVFHILGTDLVVRQTCASHVRQAARQRLR